MFSAVAHQLFGEAMEAGKVMGLAPYGAPQIDVAEFLSIREGMLEFSDVVVDRFPHQDRWPQHEDVYRVLAASARSA
jgi:carbamoyltransferase